MGKLARNGLGKWVKVSCFVSCDQHNNQTGSGKYTK